MTDEFNNTLVTNTENDPVRSLIGELGHVEVPGDFNFRVKARIAQGKPARRSQSWMPVWVKAAAPLGLALVVGGYMFSGALFSGSVEMQPVAGFQPQTAVPVPQFAEPTTTLPVDTTVATVAPVPIAPSAKGTSPKTEKIIPAVKPKREVPAGGSYDVGQRVPRGPASNSSGNSVTPPSTGLGYTITSTGGSRSVIAVAAGSPAAKADVRVGDVIESASGNTLTIRRDGKTIVIVIQ